MKRMSLVVMYWALMCSTLEAAQCPPRPNPPVACPHGCQTPSALGCKVDTTWLVRYENCSDPHNHHPAIWVGLDKTLTIVKANVGDPDFKVEPFKSYNLIINGGKAQCDLSSTWVPASAFRDSAPGYAGSHVLTPLLVGCYEVNLTLNLKDDNGNDCTIDPHIIIKGDGMSPTALDPTEHEKK